MSGTEIAYAATTVISARTLPPTTKTHLISPGTPMLASYARATRRYEIHLISPDTPLLTSYAMSGTEMGNPFNLAGPDRDVMSGYAATRCQPYAPQQGTTRANSPDTDLPYLASTDVGYGARRLHCPYALSGTDIAYAQAALLLEASICYELVGPSIVQRACYAMSGTEMASSYPCAQTPALA
eukprot:1795533-Rhodomonas_salina.5